MGRNVNPKEGGQKNTRDRANVNTPEVSPNIAEMVCIS